MLIPQLILLAFAACVTVIGVSVKDNMLSLKILSIQAFTLIAVNLAYYAQRIIEASYTPSSEDIASIILEILVTVIIVPLIIRVVKNSLVRERIGFNTPPLIEFKRNLPILAAFNIGYLIFAIYLAYYNIIPSVLQLLPLTLLVFLNSVVGMIVNKDSVKIIIALNMAFNAFTPLLSNLPLTYVILELTSLILVNIIAVFIIVQMIEKYKTINVSEWSVNYD
ncbi:MAG: hypothetical protein OdinLCB4_007135 [Candidatus Odinarchaeum yellowstonii]|uniref:Uncharacterized protein n=1 Tax=Odinarchaeota yellowstonii (strain LCB_4) TaxID=1841599 RepID=A0AAF0D229_ODILC|nr:MAG: hypothetical protein OdinLCB4_007135 [Candidatus Odinarchaeum yellowstonii]